MKRTFLFSLITLFSISIYAQEVQFGIKSGLNVAGLSGETFGLDYEARIAFHAGAFVEIPFADKLALQSELLYSAQGYKVEGDLTDLLVASGVLSDFLNGASLDLLNGIPITGESSGKYDYLNIPIMLKYYIADDFSLELGPQIGFLLSAKADADVSINILGMEQSFSQDQDIKDNLESFDAALNIGAGYKLDNGLNFGARYSLGLTEISELTDNKNQVFQLSIGYFFN